MKNDYKTLVLVIILFGSITAAQFLAAAVARSEALLIDSVSMLVDTLTYVVNLCAAKCHHDVAELTAAGISIVVLLAASVWGIVEACGQLLHPTSGAALSPDIVLVFGIWGIIFDCLSCLGFYKWGRHFLFSSSRKRYEEFDGGPTDSIAPVASEERQQTSASSSINMRSAFMHVGADFLRSLIIVGEGMAVKFEGTQGRASDSIAALIVSATILLGAVGAIVPLLRQVIAWRRRCAARASKSNVQAMAERMASDAQEPIPTSIGARSGGQ